MKMLMVTDSQLQNGNGLTLVVFTVNLNITASFHVFLNLHQP